MIKLTCKSSGNCVFARWEACGRQSLSLGRVIRSEQKLKKKINKGKMGRAGTRSEQAASMRVRLAWLNLPGPKAQI